MAHSLRDHERFARVELHRPVLKVDEPFPFDHVEELVRVVVRMPVVLPMPHAEAVPRVVDLAEGLVEPLVLTAVRDLAGGNDLERSTLDLQPIDVGELRRIGHPGDLGRGRPTIVGSLKHPALRRGHRSPPRGFRRPGDSVASRIEPEVSEPIPPTVEQGR